jgi:hypothetical protein
VSWEADDLRDVCLFLKAVPKQNRLPDTIGRLRKLVRRGLKKFPEAPDFPLMMGILELDKGPVHCNRGLARRCFKRARDLAGKLGPQYAFIVEESERKLAFLAEVGVAPWMPPAMRGGRGREESFDEDGPVDDLPPGGLFAAFARVCESMGLDPEDVLEDISGGGPFRFPPPGPDRERKRKRKR